MSVEIGSILDDRYQIIESLDHGTTGAVYKACDLRLKQDVVIKCSNLSSSEGQHVFNHEAILLAKLDHPNIPKVSNYFSKPNVGSCIVMDFIEGTNLEKLAESGPIDEDKVLSWMEQIFLAVKYLHSQNPPIIHRDIKPRNIIIANDGNAFLVDFGIAQTYQPIKKAKPGEQSATLGYASPEQFRGITSQSSDIYSLGATLYTILTGDVLTYDPNGIRTLPFITSKNPDVSQNVSDAVYIALNPNPEGRFESVEKFWDAIRSNHPMPSPPPVISIWIRIFQEFTSRKLYLLSWSVIVILMVIIIGLLWQNQNEENKDPTYTPTPFIVEAEIITSPTPTNTLSPAPTTQVPVVTPTIAVPTDDQEMSPTVIPPIDNMVLITEGYFIMGSDPKDTLELCNLFKVGCEEKAFIDEGPIHTVWLSEYYIDKYEVSGKDYVSFLNNLNNPSSAISEYLDISLLNEYNFFNESAELWAVAPYYSDRPMFLVSWFGAEAYCNSIGARLPTEAEWEKAARGVNGKNYPWGDRFNYNNANYCDQNCKYSWQSHLDDAFGFLAPVGSYPSGAFGLFDMAGNVWEWVADWYSSSYYKDSPDTNPLGPSSGTKKVIRGGSWNSIPYDLLTSARAYNVPSYKNPNIGFRCAWSK